MGGMMEGRQGSVMGAFSREIAGPCTAMWQFGPHVLPYGISLAITLENPNRPCTAHIQCVV